MNDHAILFVFVTAALGFFVYVAVHQALVARPRKLRRLVESAKERAAVVVVSAGSEEYVAYLVARIRGQDYARLRAEYAHHRLLPDPSQGGPPRESSLDPRDPGRVMLRAAALQAFEAQRPEAPWDGSMSAELRPALESRLAELGCELLDARNAHLARHDASTKRRHGWRVTRATYADGDADGGECDGLELWLDATSQVGLWKVNTSLGVLRSPELFERVDAEVEAYGHGVPRAYLVPFAKLGEPE